MNKTVILIQLIISSSLPNPIDEIITSRAVGDFKITESEAPFKIDAKKPPVLLNLDDIITRSEVNQNNKIYSGIRRLKGSEEQEDTVIEDFKFISSKPNINNSELKETEEVNPVIKLSQQFKLEKIAKTEDVQTKVNDIESTTTNFDVNRRSGDDLEEPTDSPIEFNLSKNAEEESNIPNDVYNSEWDLFDDTISTRRMLKNFEGLSEETKETTFMEDENINSVPNLNAPENIYRRLSGVVEKQDEEKDDYLQNIQNKNIIENSAQQTSAIKKEEENKNKHLEGIQNHKVKGDNERRASDITKHAENIRISNLDHGQNFDKKYESENTEVIQRIPFIYPSPIEVQRYNQPAIPIFLFDSENFNKYKIINRLSPVTRRQEFEDYSPKSYYRKHLYIPAELAQKSMTTNIISKLKEASENFYKAAGKEHFKNFKPFTSFHNVNKNVFVPRY